MKRGRKSGSRRRAIRQPRAASDGQSAKKQERNSGGGGGTADLPFLGVQQTGAAPAAASARRLPITSRDRRKAGIDVRGVFIRLQLPINYPFDSGKQAGV